MTTNGFAVSTGNRSYIPQCIISGLGWRWQMNSSGRRQKVGSNHLNSLQWMFSEHCRVISKRIVTKALLLFYSFFMLFIYQNVTENIIHRVYTQGIPNISWKMANISFSYQHLVVFASPIYFTVSIRSSICSKRNCLHHLLCTRPFMYVLMSAIHLLSVITTIRFIPSLLITKD